MEKPLLHKVLLLQKYPGKGGWTYAAIPQIAPSKNKSFGWVKVKGSIDGFNIKSYHLMPMGNGQLFLPVKAEIRKKIKKEAGDTVEVVLFADTDSFEVPYEFLSCLKDETKAYQFFLKLSESEQKNYVKWIYSAKKVETKVQRIAESINRLMKNKKLFEKEN